MSADDTGSPSSIILAGIAFASSIMTSVYIVAFRNRAREALVGISLLAGPVCNEEAGKSHVLHVCTKCSTANRKVAAPDRVQEAPQAPRDKTPKPQTGQYMLERITEALALRSTSDDGRCSNGDAGQTADSQKWQQINALAFRHAQTGNTLRINPTECFSACQQANCVAFSSPCKYSYHFGLLDHDSLEDIEDIVGFADDYCAAGGEYKTKATERPRRLGKGNTISRVPPLMGAGDLSSH